MALDHSPLKALRAVGVAAIGTGFSLCFPIVTGALQTEVPDALRGRLMSIHQMAHIGNRPFVALAAGAIAASFGVPIACLAALALVPPGLAAVRAMWRGLDANAAREPAAAQSVRCGSLPRSRRASRPVVRCSGLPLPQWDGARPRG